MHPHIRRHRNLARAFRYPSRPRDMPPTRLCGTVPGPTSRDATQFVQALFGVAKYSGSIVHITLSFPPRADGDAGITDDLMRECLQVMMRAFGCPDLAARPYVAWRHHDTAIDHCHLVCLEASLTGHPLPLNTGPAAIVRAGRALSALVGVAKEGVGGRYEPVRLVPRAPVRRLKNPMDQRLFEAIAKVCRERQPETDAALNEGLKHLGFWLERVKNNSGAQSLIFRTSDGYYKAGGALSNDLKPGRMAERQALAARLRLLRAVLEYQRLFRVQDFAQALKTLTQKDDHDRADYISDGARPVSRITDDLADAGGNDQRERPEPLAASRPAAPAGRPVDGHGARSGFPAGGDQRGAGADEPEARGAGGHGRETSGGAGKAPSSASLGPDDPWRAPVTLGDWMALLLRTAKALGVQPRLNRKGDRLEAGFEDNSRLIVRPQDLVLAAGGALSTAVRMARAVTRALAWRWNPAPEVVAGMTLAKAPVGRGERAPDDEQVDPALDMVARAGRGPSRPVLKPEVREAMPESDGCAADPSHGTAGEPENDKHQDRTADDDDLSL